MKMEVQKALLEVMATIFICQKVTLINLSQ